MISILDLYAETDTEKIRKLSLKVKEYTEGLKKLNFRNWVMDKQGYSFFKSLIVILGLIAFLPVFVGGRFRIFYLIG